MKAYKPSGERSLKSISVNTQSDWKPTGIAFNDEAQHHKRNIVNFFTPILLIVALGFGIAYGGWKILVDIQKLRIVPADNLPIILSEFKIDPA